MKVNRIYSKQHVRCLLSVLISSLPAMSYLACKSLPQSDLQVIGGAQANKDEYPAVQMISVGGVGICTGTFLSDRVMLTASHCIIKGTESGGVSFEGIKAQRFFNWPKAVTFNSEDNSIRDDQMPYDAAFVVFPKQTARRHQISEWIKFSPVAPKTQDPVHLIGFGKTHFDLPGTSGEKYRGRNQLEKIEQNGGLLTFSGTRSSDTISERASIAPGDSGGPLLSKDGHILGVASAVGDYNSYLTSNYASVYGRPFLELLKNAQNCNPAPCIGNIDNGFQHDEGAHQGFRVVFRERIGNMITAYAENEKYRFLSTEYMVYRFSRDPASHNKLDIIYDARSSQFSNSEITDLHADDRGLYIVGDNFVLERGPDGTPENEKVIFSVADLNSKSWRINGSQLMDSALLITTNAQLFALVRITPVRVQELLRGVFKDLYLRKALIAENDLYVLGPERLYRIKNFLPLKPDKPLPKPETLSFLPSRQITDFSLVQRSKNEVLLLLSSKDGLFRYLDDIQTPTEPLNPALIEKETSRFMPYSLGLGPKTSIYGIIITSQGIYVHTEKELWKIIEDVPVEQRTDPRLNYIAKNILNLPETPDVLHSIASEAGKGLVLLRPKADLISTNGGKLFRLAENQEEYDYILRVANRKRQEIQRMRQMPQMNPTYGRLVDRVIHEQWQIDLYPEHVILYNPRAKDQTNQLRIYPFWSGFGLNGVTVSNGYVYVSSSSTVSALPLPAAE